MQWLGGCGFPNFQHTTIRSGQDDSHDLMRAELLSEARPRPVNPRLQEPMLDGCQEVIGQHTKKDVSLGPIFEVLKNRSLHQGALHVSKRIFDPRQQNVEAPDFIGRQILTIPLQHIAAVELFGHRFLVGLLLPGQLFFLESKPIR